MRVSIAAWATLGPAVYSLVIVGLAVNGGTHDDKWVKVTDAADRGRECWVDRADVHSEQTCCPSPAGQTPCNPLGEWLADVLESATGAYLLPLVPWILNVNVRLLKLREQNHDIRRLFLHGGILAIRALILWLAFDKIEEAIVGTEATEAAKPALDQSSSCTERGAAGQCDSNPDDMLVECATTCTTTCWYGYMRTDFECSELFDFSDHLVLYMVAYFATAGVEAYAYVASGRFTWLVFAPLATAFIIVLTICTYRSVAFFHTPSEGIAGWVISFLFIHLPLFMALRHERGSRLHYWIVEPPPPNSQQEALAFAMTSGPEISGPQGVAPTSSA